MGVLSFLGCSPWKKQRPRSQPVDPDLAHKGRPLDKPSERSSRAEPNFSLARKNSAVSLSSPREQSGGLKLRMTALGATARLRTRRSCRMDALDSDISKSSPGRTRRRVRNKGPQDLPAEERLPPPPVGLLYHGSDRHIKLDAEHHTDERAAFPSLAPERAIWDARLERPHLPNERRSCNM